MAVCIHFWKHKRQALNGMPFNIQAHLSFWSKTSLFYRCPAFRFNFSKFPVPCNGIHPTAKCRPKSFSPTFLSTSRMTKDVWPAGSFFFFCKIGPSSYLGFCLKLWLSLFFLSIISTWRGLRGNSGLRKPFASIFAFDYTFLRNALPNLALRLRPRRRQFFIFSNFHQRNK